MTPRRKRSTGESRPFSFAGSQDDPRDGCGGARGAAPSGARGTNLRRLLHVSCGRGARRHSRVGLYIRADRTAREQGATVSDSFDKLEASIGLLVDTARLGVAELQKENDRLTRENRSLWAQVHELQDAESERKRKVG